MGAFRPQLRYSLLDIERRFGCAEGHVGTKDLVTFHFWSSDFRTREVVPSEEDGSDAGNAASSAEDLAAEDVVLSRIRMRDGIERVAKASLSKAELFELFFGPGGSELPAAAAEFLEAVRTPRPLWKGMCAVTAVGIEALVD